MALYRNRALPYAVSAEGELRSLWAYITTNAPSTWSGDPTCRDAYERIYGKDALALLDSKNVVSEGIDPVWIGGTFHADPARRVQQVYGGSVVETPTVLPWERPEWSGFSKGEAAILAALEEIKKLLKP